MDKEGLRSNPAPERCDGLPGDPKVRNTPVGQNADVGICKDQNGSPQTTNKEDCPIPPNTSWTKTATVQSLKGNPEDLFAKIGCTSIGTSGILACTARVVQFLFITLPAFLLVLAAKLFDFMAGLTLSSEMYKFEFVEKMWRVIRDFSNIFFILVLLYAALQTILGIGHGGAKKTIATVILIALVVNFSLFATRVVIDSGNILGLIFYNKIAVTDDQGRPVSNPEGQIGNAAKTKVPERSISRAIASKFDIGVLLTKDKTAGLGTESSAGVFSSGVSFGIGCAIGSAVPIPGVTCLVGGGIGILLNFFTADQVYDDGALLRMMGFMVAYGLVIWVLAYAFFVTALSFLGRIITLIMLMIVSPFAFMSYTIPGLKKMGKVGFDSWLHSLLSASFVAAVFMFILYVSSEIMRAGMFEKMSVAEGSRDLVAGLIVTFVPAILIAMLLLAGARYAKKASGEFSEKIISVGKAAVGVVGGLAVGAAVGGAAILGRAGLGRIGAAVGRSGRLKEIEAGGGLRGFGAARLRDIGKFGAASSFDLRGVKVAGKSLASTTGLKVGEAQKGGFEERRKKQVEKRVNRAKELEVGEDEGLKQTVRQREAELQTAKSDRATQDRLTELNNGDHVSEPAATATAELAVATATANPAIQAMEQGLLGAMNRASDANAVLDRAKDQLAAHPTDPAFLAAQQAAQAQVNLANQGLAMANNAMTAAQTLADNVVAATEALAANPADPALNAALAAANAAAAANPAAQAMAARDVALANQARVQSLPQLERAAAAGQRGLTDAERALKTAVDQFGARSREADTARVAQTRALAERERTRENLETRQADIREAGVNIHNAEVALKRAENAVIGENAQRRENYARATLSEPGQAFSFVMSGFQHSFAGAEEAANRIRSGIQEEKKISTDHH